MEQEFESAPSPGGDGDNRQWRLSLLWLALLILLVVVLQLSEVRIKRGGSGSGDRDQQALLTGDFLVKVHLAGFKGSSDQLALRYYKKAVPSPAAFRRMGVLKGGSAGRLFFSRLDWRDTTKGLTEKQIGKLRQEKAMWLRVYDSTRLSPEEASRYISRIRGLDLGPLADAAAAKVYERAGQYKKSLEVTLSARDASRHALVAGMLLVALMCVGGVLGLILAIVFFIDASARFAAAPTNGLPSPMLIRAFIIYLASYISLGAAVQLLADGAGLSASSTAVDVALLIVSAALAFAIGMLALAGGVKPYGRSWREVGFRTRSAGRDVAWGVAGYFSSLPFLFVAYIIAIVLQQTVFRHIQTPQQPFGGIVSRGGALDIFLVFLAASVVAPVVEETFFRGVLYSAFRGRWKVWPSVAVTSAIFAVIHPLPGGFVPIFALACVLALLRERSGSLLPGMVTHGVFNTVQLLMLMIIT